MTIATHARSKTGTVHRLDEGGVPLCKYGPWDGIRSWTHLRSWTDLTTEEETITTCYWCKSIERYGRRPGGTPHRIHHDTGTGWPP